MPSKSITKTFFLFSILVFYFSCKKEPKLNQFNDRSTQEMELTNSNISAVSRSEDLMTVIGNKKTNPFTLEIMEQAYFNLTGRRPRLEATDLYIKFTPQNEKEMVALEESDVDAFDFPLDHEIIEMGEYYHDPSIPVDGFTYFYAVIKPDDEMPEVQYEILESLFLTPYKSLLTAEAFRLTRNNYEYSIPEKDGLGEEGGTEDFGDCQPGCENYPCCLFFIEPQCDPFGTLPQVCNLDLDCLNSTSTPQDYLYCIDNIYSGGAYNPYYTNECGCQVFNNSRKPGGTVKVEDTQKGMEGVKDVRIIYYGGWFQINRVQTDNNGCWRIDEEHYGKAWMYVKFKNKRARLRGTGKGFQNIWRWLTTIKDHAKTISGPYYNNELVTYDMWEFDNDNAIGGGAHRHWGAATVINALNEYHEEALADGITPPSNGLDIYINKKQRRGYALMTSSFSKLKFAETIGTGFGILTYNFLDDIVDPQGPFLEELLDLVGIIPGLGAAAGGSAVGYIIHDIWQDVSIGINYSVSDRLKRLTYHELSHTSHFENVGQDWWSDLTAITIGNGNDPMITDPGIPMMALAEGWAGFIGNVYVDRRYELDHSNFNSGTLPSIEEERFINLLEESNNLMLEDGYTPTGLFYDLIDDNSNPIAGSTENSNVINDDVFGYSIEDLFQGLIPLNETVEDWKIFLSPNPPVGVTSTDVIDLFNDYGY